MVANFVVVASPWLGAAVGECDDMTQCRGLWRPVNVILERSQQDVESEEFIEETPYNEQPFFFFGILRGMNDRETGRTR